MPQVVHQNVHLQHPYLCETTPTKGIYYLFSILYINIAKKTIEEETQEERERLQLLVSAFSNAQQDQYEIFRRSTFPKAAIKKIMQSVSGSSVPQNAVIAMAGITKVSVGDVIFNYFDCRVCHGTLNWISAPSTNHTLDIYIDTDTPIHMHTLPPLTHTLTHTHTHTHNHTGVRG